MFFGDLSPKDKPEFYIQCIHSVYQTYADHYKNEVPLIVNTQGWVKGELLAPEAPLSIYKFSLLVSLYFLIIVNWRICVRSTEAISC